MYIYKIVIENFRNFESFSWKPNKSVNVLFGHNGSGKTNIAEALSMVFSQKSNNFFDIMDFYLGDDSRKIRIQVWLDEVDDLKIDISLVLQHVNLNDEFLNDDSEECARKLVIFQLESGQERKKEWSYFLTTEVKACPFAHRDAVNFIYIDADRQPLKEINLSGRSLLFQLSKNVINDEINRISKLIVDNANKELEKSDVINKFVVDLKKLYDIKFIDSYEILLKNPATSWNYSGYELGTINDNVKLSFDRQAKGFQNLFLLILMKQKLSGAGVVFIEEIEQNLEPKYQRYIVDEYKKLTVGQLFITSHSVDVISHFDFCNIFTLTSKEAKQVFSCIDVDAIKEICKLNKKEFISALMASKVLLVEGESEYASLPVYSLSDETSFHRLDIEVLNVGGKSKFIKYAKALKKFDKRVYVLLDDDKDVKQTLKEINGHVDEIYVADNCYEDMIYQYIKPYCNELNDLVDFQLIKNKLFSILTYEPKEGKIDNKKLEVKDIIEKEKINVDELATYSDIAGYEQVFKYILHDSFVTTYFARNVANIITSNQKLPYFFVELCRNISSQNKTIKKYSSNYENVYKLTRNKNVHA